MQVWSVALTCCMGLSLSMISLWLISRVPPCSTWMLAIVAICSCPTYSSKLSLRSMRNPVKNEAYVLLHQTPLLHLNAGDRGYLQLPHELIKVLKASVCRLCFQCRSLLLRVHVAYVR